MLPLSAILVLNPAWASVMTPWETSPILADWTIAGGFAPAGHLAAQIPQVVQVLRLSRTEASGASPSPRALATMTRPRVFFDSQPRTSKAGQTDRQVPHRTQSSIVLGSMEISAVSTFVSFVSVFVSVPLLESSTTLLISIIHSLPGRVRRRGRAFRGS